MTGPGLPGLAPSTVALLDGQGLDVDDLRRVVSTALQEDLRLGPDVTTLSTVGPTARTTGSIVPRASGVLAGLGVAVAVLDLVCGPDWELVHVGADGHRAIPGEPVLTVTAPTAALLTAERTMLNLLCHLSGVATATDAWVQAVAGTSCRIRDTRKTLPGLRQLQKYAVRAGGGVNHRLALGDAALIKDNHVVAAGGVVAAMRLVRAAAPDLHCEVEVDSLDQLDAVLAEGAELVLLDNFDITTTAEAVRRRDAVAPGTGLESSGGLTLAVAGDYARTGVDFVAVGALTHSVTALDLGLDLD